MRFQSWNCKARWKPKVPVPSTIRGREPSQNNAFCPQKSCGQLLGESWPRAIRSGTGRGGDVTGSRVSLLGLSVIAGGGSGDRGAAVAKRDPHIGIALRLTLDEAVSGLGP